MTLWSTSFSVYYYPSQELAAVSHSFPVLFILGQAGVWTVIASCAGFSKSTGTWLQKWFQILDGASVSAGLQMMVSPQLAGFLLSCVCKPCGLIYRLNNSCRQISEHHVQVHTQMTPFSCHPKQKRRGKIL